MTEQRDSFDIQTLTVANENWTVELIFESWSVKNKMLSNLPHDVNIELNDSGKWTASLYLKIKKTKESEYNCLISGIDGGCYFYISTDTDKSQSVKLVDNTLILSMGFTILALNLDNASVKWKVKPDSAAIFEFYDLESDILLRGEIEIHRIDYSGNVKWSYSGRDIWVNPDGKKEVTIEDNLIRLIDFESNEYLIDFNGSTIK